MPPVSCQPVHHHQVAASLLEDNTLACAVQQEWDNEWNSMGLASRLSPEVNLYCVFVYLLPSLGI